MNLQNAARLEAVIDKVTEPLGDQAPKKHNLCVDYKENGADRNMTFTIWLPPAAPDAEVVKLIFELMKAPGRIIIGITEQLHGGYYVYYLNAEEIEKDAAAMRREEKHHD